MRLFIAIDIDGQIKNALSNLQKQLQKQIDIRKNDVKWVNPENTHLTLKFLGEVKDDKVAGLCNIVKDVAKQFRNFDFDIEQLGCFGGQSARVLWVGTGTGGDDLCELAKELEKQLARAGWPGENREFAGHLTICRVKNAKAGFELANICDDYKEFKAGTVTVDSIKIYQSRLTPAGAIYTVVGNFKLQ